MAREPCQYLQPAWLQEPAWLISVKSLRGSAASVAAGACVAHRPREPAGLSSLRGCIAQGHPEPAGLMKPAWLYSLHEGHPEPAGLSSLRGCIAHGHPKPAGLSCLRGCSSPTGSCYISIHLFFEVLIYINYSHYYFLFLAILLFLIGNNSVYFYSTNNLPQVMATDKDDKKAEDKEKHRKKDKDRRHEKKKDSKDGKKLQGERT